MPEGARFLHVQDLVCQKLPDSFPLVTEQAGDFENTRNKSKTMRLRLVLILHFLYLLHSFGGLWYGKKSSEGRNLGLQ